MLYINQYYPRPGTPAAKMKRVPTRDVKQRTKQLTDLFHSYEPYRKRIGQKYQVLVTELAHDKQHYVGHNEFYEQVLLISDILSFFRPIFVMIRLCLILPQNRRVFSPSQRNYFDEQIRVSKIIQFLSQI